MTTTYDPFHPAYLDVDDLREEMDRVYDLCHGCRLCFKFCPAFPTLFEAIDRHDDQDSAKLTDQERFQVVDECFNCKLCGELNCPYTPGKHEWALDFPRLMLRAKATQHATGTKTLRTKVTDQALGRTDAAGKVGSALSAVANKVVTAPGSTPRKVLEKATGIASERILPPYAKQRFSRWFAGRATAAPSEPQAHATLFPTCLVEYQDTAIGQDLVKVLDRNRVACDLPDGQQCCGAPALHQGDLARFVDQGRRNVGVLAAAIRAADARGERTTVVVPEPTCSFVLKQDYPTYIGGADAELVAERTMDAAEFLWKQVHKADGGELDTDFAGEVPDEVTYHAACHLRAQNIGYKSRDLLKLTGTKVRLVAECSGIDGTWGLRAENLDAARKVAGRLTAGVEKAGNSVVCGDCSLANGGIALETGARPSHPIQVVARAYGIDPEPNATSR
jgi:Fe-S oxidoreductase